MRRFLPLLLWLGVGCRMPDPSIGQKIQLPTNAEMLVTSSAQLWPSTTRLINGIEYTLAADSDSRVVFISTSSSHFRTPEGLSINSTLEQVKAAGGQGVIYEGGWHYYACLPSGWCAGFYGISEKGGSIQVRQPPRSSTKIEFFFRR